MKETELKYICDQKSKKMIFISEAVEKKLKNLCSYNLKDDRLPTVLCPTCKNYVYKGLKIKKSTQRISLEENIENFLSIKRDLRSQSETCNCYLYNSVKKRPKKIVQKNDNLKKKKNKIWRCYKCCTPIGKGIKHKYRNFT